MSSAAGSGGLSDEVVSWAVASWWEKRELEMCSSCSLKTETQIYAPWGLRWQEACLLSCYLLVFAIVFQAFLSIMKCNKKIMWIWFSLLLTPFLNVLVHSSLREKVPQRGLFHQNHGWSCQHGGGSAGGRWVSAPPQTAVPAQVHQCVGIVPLQLLSGLCPAAGWTLLLSRYSKLENWSTIM